MNNEERPNGDGAADATASQPGDSGGDKTPEQPTAQPPDVRAQTSNASVEGAGPADGHENQPNVGPDEPTVTLPDMVVSGDVDPASIPIRPKPGTHNIEPGSKVGHYRVVRAIGEGGTQRR